MSGPPPNFKPRSVAESNVRTPGPRYAADTAYRYGDSRTDNQMRALGGLKREALSPLPQSSRSIGKRTKKARAKSR
jgi:hypothetical protein